MNEACNEKDYEAAVVELKRGNRKSLLKFASVMILLFLAVLTVAGFTLSIGPMVRSFFGV